MTIEEQIEHHKAASQFTMKVAFFFGLWFVVTYLIGNYMTGDIFWILVRFLIALITPIALFFIVEKVRDKFYDDMGMSKLRGWYLCMKVMLLAGMIEAVGIGVYNQWINPDALTQLYESRIAELSHCIENLHYSNEKNDLIESALPALEANLDDLKHMPQLTPFENALNHLSLDVTWGMLMGIPICFMLYKNPRIEQTSEQEENAENENNKD